MRVTCREAGCSRECADARAEAAARDLIAQFLANPPTHMIRVSVHDEDIDDEEIEKRIRSLCRALKRHGCREYVDAVHFFEARRHDHIAVIYDGDAADPEAHLRDVVDRVFVGLHITRYAQPRDKEPPALARYLVQALKPENKRDVELPPEGFDGKRLLRRSRGYNIKRKKEEQQVYAMPADFPCRTVETGEQEDVIAYAFDADAIRAYGDSRAPSGSTDGHPAEQDEPSRREPDELIASFGVPHLGGQNAGAEDLGSEACETPASQPRNDSMPSEPAHSAQQEGTSATSISLAHLFPRERIPRLHTPVRDLYSRRADPRDGSLGEYDLLGLLNGCLGSEGFLTVGAALDALVETDFLRETEPGRFVLAAAPQKAA